MEQIVLNVASLAQLDEQLQTLSQQYPDLEPARVLVQLYTTRNEKAWIVAIHQQVQYWLPDVPVVGCSAMGVMCPGAFLDADTTLSILILREAHLLASIHSVATGEEQEVGRRIAAQLFCAHPHLQGVLLLATPVLIDCGNLLRELTTTLDDIPVFGALAGSHLQPASTCVFLNGQTLSAGVAVVAFYGSALRISTNSYLGWQPFGEMMTVTGMEGCELVSLNGKPAYEVYHHFVGVERDEFFDQAVDFPLMVHRDGKLIARAPVAATDDHHLMLLAPLQEGDQLQLGYGDVDSIFSDLSYACDRVHDFQPEAVLAFSCCCRLYFLMEDANAELSPYQHVAPVVGFFTLGEIDSTYVGDDVLNATIVTVALSELPAVSGQREPGPATSTVNTSRNLNRIKRLMRFISRVTEQLYAANDELTYLASRDELTGILNRRALMARLHEEWARSFRYGTPMSLIMLDIDHFKQVNDRFGHQVGDEVLVRFTTLVQNELRINDLFARYGGEEFIILLPQTRETEAVALAERIRCVLEVQAEQPSLPGITCSFGVAQWHGSMVDVYELLQYADRALYRAKQAGRNRVEAG